MSESLTEDTAPRDRSRDAAELGLASLLIGAPVLVSAPIVTILAAQIWAHGFRAPHVVLLHAWLARIAVSIPILLVLFGGWLGAAGNRHAMRAGCCAWLPRAGVVLNLAAFGAWVLASIALLNTTESLLLLVR